MRLLFAVIATLFVIFSGHAQELNARVNVSMPQVPNVNPRTVEVLEKVVFDVLNGHTWSNVGLGTQERIDCSFNIVITDFDGINKYTATAQINSVRPVFGTNYHTPVLSFRDRYFNFTYTEGDQLDFNVNQNMNPLSSLLAFYAYTIIGMDMDTFKSKAGTGMFSQARNIVNYSQSRQNEGWRAMEATDNRYWLINNLLDRNYDAYRTFAYQYHREGLDKMVENEAAAKKTMSSLLEQLKNVDRMNPGNVLSNAFYTAKSTEFVGLFTRMPGNESARIYNLLAELDPANLPKYDKLKN